MIRREPLLRQLRVLSRFCVGRANQQICRMRTLSATDAVNALRPFYFAVHPDFFGQYPREREVNENSLKRLSSYLECMQRPGYRALQPTQLTFYIRETTGDTNLPQQCVNTAVYPLTTSRTHRLTQTCNIEMGEFRSVDPYVGIRPTTPSPATETQRKSSTALNTWNLHLGCTLIFADNSGVNAVGQIMLGTVDVHHHWTKILERLPVYYKLHSQLSLLEERISYLLGDVQLIYDEDLQPAMMLEDYYRMLKAFHQCLVASRPLFHPRSLKGLQMILENDSTAPSLLKAGQLTVPVTCDPIALQWFILAHAQEARSYLRREEELEVEQEKLISDCRERLGLKRLYKEPSVSSQQMVKCCQRLLDGHVTELQGMHLCVSHFYSVLQDGDLCIPWDWKK
ncbi:T-cell activation inhibitor, mitochondrial isoform X5 [Heptranchias perlo]|uniref:T-cell activation inhibitor, mitochondrial isoform X5 n=1 Tax=Heptranchias perlo TaxID=212740 RepID=UPI00355AB237